MDDSYGEEGQAQFKSMQSHSLQQQIVELTTKVRQLEIGIMDVKASTDRRVQSV